MRQQDAPGSMGARRDQASQREQTPQSVVPLALVKTVQSAVFGSLQSPAASQRPDVRLE
jgi:hypothetical protein